MILSRCILHTHTHTSKLPIKNNGGADRAGAPRPAPIPPQSLLAGPTPPPSLRLPPSLPASRSGGHQGRAPGWRALPPLSHPGLLPQAGRRGKPCSWGVFTTTIRLLTMHQLSAAAQMPGFSLLVGLLKWKSEWLEYCNLKSSLQAQNSIQNIFLSICYKFNHS